MKMEDHLQYYFPFIYYNADKTEKDSGSVKKSKT